MAMVVKTVHSTIKNMVVVIHYRRIIIAVIEVIERMLSSKNSKRSESLIQALAQVEELYVSKDIGLI